MHQTGNHKGLPSPLKKNLENRTQAQRINGKAGCTSGDTEKNITKENWDLQAIGITDLHYSLGREPNIEK